MTSVEACQVVEACETVHESECSRPQDQATLNGEFALQLFDTEPSTGATVSASAESHVTGCSQPEVRETGPADPQLDPPRTTADDIDWELVNALTTAAKVREYNRQRRATPTVPPGPEVRPQEEGPRAKDTPTPPGELSDCRSATAPKWQHKNKPKPKKKRFL